MSETLKSYFWVALGSMLGGVGRFWMSNLVTGRANSIFPWDILLINITGSFLIGILSALSAEGGPLMPSRSFVSAFLMIGVCGGFTTFSSFSLHTLRLMREKQWMYAGGNIVGSVLFCLVAVWLGFMLGRLFTAK